MTTTATPDPQTAISAAADDIERLTAERERVGLDTLRGVPNAKQKWESIDAEIAVRRRDLSVAQDALAGLYREQAEAALNATAEQRAADETELAAFDGSRRAAYASVESHMGSLVIAIGEALTAGDGAFNAAQRLGYPVGSPNATKDRISGRISHLLNMGGLGSEFSFGLGAMQREPLIAVEEDK